LKLGVATLLLLQLNSTPFHTIFAHFQAIFITAIYPIITSVTDQDPVSNEESLIDLYLDIFDTKITISPISISRRNLPDNVGRCIPFLEVVQATIVPYVVKVTFSFPEFIGWCTEKYSHEEKLIVNK
jgi:hypothetical protein